MRAMNFLRTESKCQICGVMVVTSALRAEGCRIHPGRNLLLADLSIVSDVFTCRSTVLYHTPRADGVCNKRIFLRHRRVVLWCSGYHVCFTRRRSPVRSRPGPFLSS
uniref:Secreted protein n=1 Tax=Heterorhabditis bacteriophora TaxID=37862 RepID=A0A1I7X3Z4_HETBA